MNQFILKNFTAIFTIFRILLKANIFGFSMVPLKLVIAVLILEGFKYTITVINTIVVLFLISLVPLTKDRQRKIRYKYFE